MPLYEPIKPACLDRINEEREKYPHIHAEMIEALKSHEFYIDMKYSDVLSLEASVGQPVHEMFYPSKLVSQ